MEQERILNSLALLEQNINEINTAKQQVDSVVKEYGDTHKAIDKAEKTLAKFGLCWQNDMQTSTK